MKIILHIFALNKKKQNNYGLHTLLEFQEQSRT